jgi:ribosomal protein L40E
MELVDEETRRWYCKKDEVVFLASKGGWARDNSPNLDSAAVVKSAEHKSYALALVANLIPGGGVLYSGSKTGMAYIILTVVFLLVDPPLVLFVVLASYAHALLSVRARNRKSNLSLPAVNSIAEAERVCRNCGFRSKPTSHYCRKCGSDLVLSQIDLGETDSDKTRDWSDKTKVY